ncbi:hypothetical protein [Pseudoxanthomonas wuyuanensis]
MWKHRASVILMSAMTVAFATGATPAETAQTREPASTSSRDQHVTKPATYAIRNADDLQRHLREVPRAKSPLGRLSDVGLRRFIATLKFGRTGISSFSTTELESELTNDQIRELLILFDLGDYATALDGVALSSQAALPSERWPKLGAEAMGEWERREALLREHGVSDSPVALADRYEELFGEVRGLPLANFTSEELHAYFNAAHFTHFESGSTASLSDMQTGLAALQSNGAARKNELQAMYQSLVASRRLEQAGNFLKLHPQASDAALPQIRGEGNQGRPTVLRVDGGSGNRWRREVADSDSPQRIIVAAGLGCHFSHDAFEALQQDPTLGPIFAQHALILFNHRSTLDADAYRSWQARYPLFIPAVAWQDNDWPPLDATPTFYFLQSGKVVETVTGWPGDETIAKLQAALRKIGLATQPAVAP